MDLIKQNKFIGWVIAILVALNVFTIAIIWTLSIDGHHPSPVSSDVPPPSAPALLMQREIGLSKDQTKQYEQLREKHKEKMKGINDELDVFKLQLADEIFNPDFTEKQVDALAGKIGLLQSKLEKMRFNHFRELALLCDKEQKEKLRPILREVFGRKGPNEKPVDRPAQRRTQDPERNQDLEEEKPPRAEVRTAPPASEDRPPRPEDRSAPPSQEEKLHRLCQRLSLTPAQKKTAAAIFDSIRIKEGECKSTYRADRAEFERQKELLHQKEDEQIKSILDADQNEEYLKMIRNRGKK